MSNRELMLGKIRSALADATAPAVVPRDYRHIGTQAPGSAEAIELLVDRLHDYQATARVVAATELADAVAAALQPAASVVIAAGLDQQIVDACAADGRAVTIDGDPVVLSAGELDRIDAVVTQARVAIAVTGTIVLDGAEGQGRRAISLVPDRHLVVLRADQIVESVPEGIARLTPTAPLTLISGPSATSDIELSRVEGVHGPRNLDVLIVR
ncbi:MAG: LUD domain-containing protein [Actinomycetota bacterium]|nr:LUD domain-containing protein [Actinomycetota bacterium]